MSCRARPRADAMRTLQGEQEGQSKKSLDYARNDNRRTPVDQVCQRREQLILRSFSSRCNYRRVMDTPHFLLLFTAIGVIAFLYSSVGHAGASGYIAVMALWGIAPITIRSTALILNILVAILGSFQFWRAGHLSWNLFWPFAVLAVPAAYLGG